MAGKKFIGTQKNDGSGDIDWKGVFSEKKVTSKEKKKLLNEKRKKKLLKK